jgi:hypothetical protein
VAWSGTAFFSAKTTFWDIASCRIVELDRRFGSSYSLNHDPDEVWVGAIPPLHPSVFVTWSGTAFFSAKTTTFWDIAPCRILELDRRFGSSYSLNHDPDDELWVGAIPPLHPSVFVTCSGTDFFSAKTTTFWDIAPCRILELDRRFGSSYSLNHDPDDELWLGAIPPLHPSAFVAWSGTAFFSAKTAFWDIASCRIVELDRRFGSFYSLNHDPDDELWVGAIPPLHPSVFVTWSGTAFFSAKTTTFWDIAPCRIVELDRRFGSSYSLNHDHDDECSTRLSNVGLFQLDHTALYSRRLSLYAMPWAREIQYQRLWRYGGTKNYYRRMESAGCVHT